MTAGADLIAADIPSLDAAKITTGAFDPDRVPTLPQSKITDLTADLADRLPRIAEVVQQTGNYTLALSDSGKIIRVNSSSALSVTVPPNDTIAFPIGAQVGIIRQGTGAVTLVQGAGVAIRSIDSKKKIKGQYSSAALLKIGTDEWILVGSLEA